MDKNFLVCKSVWFYSQHDEAIFFEWINKIRCIKRFEGVGDELYLYLVRRKLTYHDIKDLIALFFRYKIDMKQLVPLKNESNEGAFKPWKHKIFPKPKRQKAPVLADEFVP